MANVFLSQYKSCCNGLSKDIQNGNEPNIYYNFRLVSTISFILLIFPFAKFAARFAKVHKGQAFWLNPSFQKIGIHTIQRAGEAHLQLLKLPGGSFSLKEQSGDDSLLKIYILKPRRQKKYIAQQFAMMIIILRPACTPKVLFVILKTGF